MLNYIKQKTKNTIRSIFKLQVFEKILLPFVKGSFVNTKFAAIPPFHNTYKNPTFRIAKKNELRLFANLYDYNDWKAYWGLKEPEREKLYTLANNAKTIIDVGTNNGWVLMNLASIVKKKGGFVYGFEPHPDTYKRCNENIKLSKLNNCKVFNMGCSDKDSELVMTTINEENSGQNRIIEINEIQPSTNVIKVKVITLDKKLAGIQKIDLIKIDVEGFELHVLKGAENLLKKHKPFLFIEIDDLLLKANHTTPNEVLNYLRKEFLYTIRNASTNEILNENASLDNCHIDIICYPLNIEH